MTEESQVADTTAKKKKGGLGKPFKKGKSGNPKGRPVGSLSITTEIKRALERIPKDQRENKRTYLELLIMKILDKAIKDGDNQMMRAIWNYVDGMPRQSIGLEGNVGALPFMIKIIKDDFKKPDKETTE